MPSNAYRALAGAGALLAGFALVLLSLVSAVPSAVSALPGWVHVNRSFLSWSDELLFFAVAGLWVGIRGLFDQCAKSVRVRIGMTGLAIAVAALLVMLLAVGRLAYPVFGLQLTASALALVVSTTYGALHLAMLGLTVAAVALTWATAFPVTGRVVGIAAGAAGRFADHDRVAASQERITAMRAESALCGPLTDATISP